MRIKSLIKRTFLAAGFEVSRHAACHGTLFVPPGHFYSPIVDLNELQRDRRWVFDRNRDIPDIDLNEAGQMKLLEEFHKFYQDIPFQETEGGGNLYYYNNPWYRHGDAIILSCMLRYARPKRLIEFGAGFSSCVTLDINRLFLRGAVECTFIDPNPERLQSLLSKYNASANIIKSRAQDINVSDFSTLEANDILFIDSTHVAKAGSDVNFHLFEVLPRLAPGVLVHFHDIFYPFEYPESWFFDENRSWNENYMLRAFLTGNKQYEVVFFNHFMALRHLQDITAGMPLFRKDPGGALWIRKLH
jgi:predicted O-methyltransferase YrrM